MWSQPTVVWSGEANKEKRASACNPIGAKKALCWTWTHVITDIQYRLGKDALTLLPASLLCKFISFLPCSFDPLAKLFSLSVTSMKLSENLYPYSMLSPHPPQIQSRCKFFGLAARLQPQLDNWPSLQALAIAWTTPADATECAKAASRLAEIVERNKDKTPAHNYCRKMFNFEGEIE